MDKENKLILYKDDEGKVNVSVRFADEDVWLTRENLAEIYATTPQNISLHIGNIYQDKELSEEGTHKKYLLVRQEGQTSSAARYNLLQFGHDNCPRLPCSVAYCCALPPLGYSLEGNGTVSHQEAIEKAEREFEIYREREMRMLESDFDKAVKRLKKQNDEDDKDES